MSVCSIYDIFLITVILIYNYIFMAHLIDHQSLELQSNVML